jgi:uncharacterized protein with HEPN domain
MTRHDDSVRLRHMLDYSREAIDMVRGRTRRDLDENRMLQLALTRLLSVIGEASSHVSIVGRARSVEIPWSDVVTTRNRILHDDFSVDCDVVWQVINHELPGLIAALERALPGHVS